MAVSPYCSWSANDEPEMSPNNPAKVTGWQREYDLAEDELDDPRALALPDWESLTRLAAALVERPAAASRAGVTWSFSPRAGEPHTQHAVDHRPRFGWRARARVQ